MPFQINLFHDRKISSLFLFIKPKNSSILLNTVWSWMIHRQFPHTMACSCNWYDGKMYLWSLVVSFQHWCKCDPYLLFLSQRNPQIQPTSSPFPSKIITGIMSLLIQLGLALTAWSSYRCSTVVLNSFSEAKYPLFFFHNVAERKVIRHLDAYAFYINYM